MPGQDDGEEPQKGAGFDDLMHDLEDNIFGVQAPRKPLPPNVVVEDEKVRSTRASERRMTLPTLVDKETADKILKDFMKEKNQHKYDLMGFELIFKPYWFFTYSAELVMRDSSKNITDAEELSGRVAIDAINAGLADYLQDLLDHEPVEVVDLADEITQVGGEAKIIEPKISEDRVERMVQQKISGVLKTEKENVAVAGFELLWSPVYRYWMTIKKKTHNVQIDGCGGYPVNYDDVPLKEKTWTDVIMGDFDMLKDPKKWKELLKNKRKALQGMVSGKGGKGANSGGGSGGGGSGGGSSTSSKWRTAEITFGPVFFIIALYGVWKKDMLMMLVGLLGLGVLFWYTNHQREKPLLPLPPPPFYGPEGQGQ